MSQTVDEQIVSLESKGMMKGVVIMLHPISQDVYLVVPPLQDANITALLLASVLHAFLANSGQRCDIYVNGKMMPLGGGYSPIIKN